MQGLPNLYALPLRSRRSLGEKKRQARTSSILLLDIILTIYTFHDTLASIDRAHGNTSLLLSADAMSNALYQR